jgi:GMP synthase (glutamine-hydrolysing)
MTVTHETIVILDFGSQYTQLIARRVRELGVYCEIVPYSTPIEKVRAREPKGLILSGGPESVFAPDAPHPDAQLYTFDRPILGICYGMQLLARHFGGQVEPARRREYGKAVLDRVAGGKLLHDTSVPTPVWMSHGDHIGEVPAGFDAVAWTASSIAAMEDPARRLYGVQFHPEVSHTPQGKTLLANFLFRVCECHGDWTVASFVDEAVERIQREIGSGKAICGLSGGVDSTVAALLVHRAIGEHLTCIFVDNGVLRLGEFEEVLQMARDHLHLNVMGIDASQSFLSKLAGVEDPETKRKIIGNEFIRVFEREARQLGDCGFLVQGTLYPDVIESVSVKGPSDVIKSHHNVGGLPDLMNLSLVEPLRELFKDEVRRVGCELGLPDEFVQRQPFPGPGLAVRIIGAVTPERLEVLRNADQIVLEEIREANLYTQIWQSFAVLLPIQSVGVMGDERTYENVAAIRAVHSVDGMTADWVPLPHEVLGRISSRIVNEVHGINRVVYDVSSKPPSTIEWE